MMICTDVLNIIRKIYIMKLLKQNRYYRAIEVDLVDL